MDSVDAIGDFTAGMREAYQQGSSKAADPDGGRTIGWRNTYEVNDKKDVRAPALNGVWSTAPYLHNGSVISLWQLLLPAAERAKVFYLGHRQYDMNHLGYVLLEKKSTLYPDATFKFDTSKPGNSNHGHEFGVDLEDYEKEDLLEYLRTF